MSDQTKSKNKNKSTLPDEAFDSTNAGQDSFLVIPLDETSVIRKHSRSFSMAARWLPADVRGDVEKLYAWCRWCDEAVDSARDLDDATVRLAILREDVQRVFDGQEVRHPASKWLAELVESRGICQAEALDLLAGMELDLHLGQVEDEQALLRYCYCAAGVVGLMMCRVMGVQSCLAEKHAIDLGMAMQLTNIAGDVSEDWKRGRSYLPKTWIEVKLPSPSDDPSCAVDGSIAPPSNAIVRGSVQRLLSMADVRYASGLEGIALLPRGCQPAIALAAKLYREIGCEILRRDARVMDGRIAVPRRRLAYLACNALFIYAANAVTYLLSSPADDATGSKFRMSSIFTGNKEQMMVLREQKMNDARYLAYLGVSLTSFMASALFVMVSVNPKESSYAELPIIYAAVCLGVGIVTNVLARKSGRAVAVTETWLTKPQSERTVSPTQGAVQSV